MPRSARVVAVGYPHHVTQRGNHGDEVFFSAGDRQQYLVWLSEYAQRYGLDVWAYCLMTNHIHIIGVPASAEALAETLRATHIKHSMRVNAQRDWRGTLWQGRFYSCALDESHLWAAVRYVERNPVRAGMVARAEEFTWSSAAAHCGRRGDPVLSSRDPLSASVRNWAEWLALPEDEGAAMALRQCTVRGVPCGSEAFVQRISEATGASFEQRQRGRPRR